jgi:hypothetical protein
MTVAISQDKLKQIVRYEDGKLFWLPRGYGKFDKQFSGNEAGHFDKKSQRIMIRWEGKLILAHRAIWVFHNGEIPEGMEIDHINGNPSDNRIENLRLCTRSQNTMNTKINCKNKTGVKGIIWNKLNKNWRGRLNCDKKVIEIGSFQCFGKARSAVMQARNEYHKEFANYGRRAA